jgi:hypothetical protein
VSSPEREEGGAVEGDRRPRLKKGDVVATRDRAATRSGSPPSVRPAASLPRSSAGHASRSTGWRGRRTARRAAGRADDPSCPRRPSTLLMVDVYRAAAPQVFVRKRRIAEARRTPGADRFRAKTTRADPPGHRDERERCAG